MSYNFVISATINADTVKEMIREAVEKQTGRTVDKVYLEVGDEYEDRPGGGSYPVFKNAKIDFKN
jgi:hypothetical protein